MRTHVFRKNVWFLGMLALAGLLLLLASAYTYTQAATTNCPAISLLPCEAVKLSPDRVFTFDGGDGGLTDGAGVGVGFTMVDPPTTPGNPAPNPLAPGYWPEKLQVTGGQLIIAATPGINFNNLNNLNNGLGIGLDLSQPASLSTSLGVLPAPPGGLAQAGLWFGRANDGGVGSSQDNYIKLVVISQPNQAGNPVWEVQMAWELNGTTVKSINDPLVANQPVTLLLDLNPSLRTVRSYYCTGLGCDPRTQPVFQTFTNVPAEWFSSDPNGINADLGTRSMGGIFATQRLAPSSLSFAFNDFRFTAGSQSEPIASQDGVDFDQWSVSGLGNPTALAWGPDNILYVADESGLLYALTLNYNQRQIASMQTFNTLQGRMVHGLAIDPASTAGNVTLWVAHADLADAQANSGTVSKLSGVGFATRQDVITGLPRAKDTHSTNSIHFGPDGKLYIAQGGNTGAGAANDINTSFGMRPEQPLSAAILVADVNAPGFDGTCASESDPSGATMDATGISAKDVPCSVQVYASGLYNSYDFVFHSNGQMYAGDNGLIFDGTFPLLNPSPLTWTPANGCEGPVTGANVASTNPGVRPDLLQRITAGGYYGHPNPSRNECVFYGANPTKGPDFPVATTSDQATQEIMDTYRYPSGMQPASNWLQPTFAFGDYKGLGGLIEYKSGGQAFCGRMDGNLLATYRLENDQVRRLRLSADGLSVLADQTLFRSTLATGGAALVNPLPLVQDPQGRLYIGESTNGLITIMEPINAGFWETRNLVDMPVGLAYAGSAVLDGKLYLVGGRTGSGVQRSLYVYDPVAKAWTALADLPAAYPAVESPAVAGYNGKLYVLGGATGFSSGAVAKAALYSVATGTWTMLPDMDSPRGAATAQVVGGALYVAGGFDGAGSSLASVAKLDLSTLAWSSAASMAAARDHAASAVVGDSWYVMGGQVLQNGGVTSAALSSVEIFNPASGWRAGLQMPTGRHSASAAVMNGVIAVMGGETAAGPSRANQAFDPATGKWRLWTDLPVARSGAAAFYFEKLIYLAGGGRSGGDAFSVDMDALYFDCSVNISLPEAELQISKTHVGNLSPGQVGATYTLRVTNYGFAATSGTVTVTDTLPAGLTATNLQGNGWSCTTSPLQCTRSDALPYGQSYPDITLTVNVALDVIPGEVVNRAGVSGGGDSDTGNNVTSNAATVVSEADLVVSKTHLGSFFQGQKGAQYEIVVRNAGLAPTFGTIVVTDILPEGLSVTSIAGTGWKCSLGTLACSRSDALAPSAVYPSITVRVDVADNAPGSVTNVAKVAGGTEKDPDNNSASDATTIVPQDPNTGFLIYLPVINTR